MNKKLLPRAKVLGPTIIRLGIVSFFTDISSEMLYPITPIFLTATLGASMASVGLIEGFAESLASILKVYAGALSDRLRIRRPFIIFGYVLAAISKPMIGIAGSWPLVLLARAVDRTGKGIRTAPRDAMISDSVPAHLQGEAFGWHRLMDTLGAAAGPLLAILFLDLGTENLRTLFFIALIPGFISVLVAFSIREIAPAAPVVAVESAPVQKLRLKNASRGFKIYLLSSTVFSLTNSTDVFLILKARQQGTTLQGSILLYCFFNLVYALSSPYLGRLSDLMRRKNVLIAGLVVYALIYLGFSFATQGWHFWALFGIYGLYMGGTEGVGKAFTVDLVPAEFKATGIGMIGTANGLGLVVASTMAGLLWDHLGSHATFIYGAMGAVLSAAILRFCRI